MVGTHAASCCVGNLALVCLLMLLVHVKLELLRWGHRFEFKWQSTLEGFALGAPFVDSCCNVRGELESASLCYA